MIGDSLDLEILGALCDFLSHSVWSREAGSLQKAQIDIGRWMTLASLTFRNWRFLIVIRYTNSSTIALRNAQSTTLLSRSASTRSVDAFVSNFSNLCQKCLSEATAGRLGQRVNLRSMALIFDDVFLQSNGLMQE
jgi:hypothetical protein